MANRFLNNITINDEYTLPSADGTADQIITTDGSGQLSFVDQSTINAGNAEHVVIYAKNTSGASISKGTPVYITGTVGATDTVEIAEADASDSAKMPAVGLLDDTLANNAFGYVITGGFMDNITTDPIDGSTPSSNDTVYVKSGGGLTLTKPTGSQLIQNIAKVGKVSGGNSGSLIVSSILRTNDVPNLSTGKIWVGTASNTAESGVVYLDETNGRMGIGTTSPGALLHVEDSAPVIKLQSSANTTSTVSFDNSSGTQRASLGFDEGNDTFRLTNTAGTSRLNLDNYAGTFSVGFSDQSGVILGTTSVTLKSNYTSTLTCDFAGKVGIGTTSPSEKLHLYNGTAYVTPIAYAASQSAYALKIGSYNSTNFDMGLQAKSTSGGSPYMSFKTSSTDDVLTVWGTSVGIGALPNQAFKLDVDGVIRGEEYLRLKDTGGTNRLYLRATSTFGTLDNGTRTFNYIANAHLFLRGVNEIMRIHTNSNVGINETSPNARLQVKESSITTFTGTGSSAQLRLRGGYTTNEYIILGFAQDSNKDIGRMAVKRGGSGSSFHWGVSTNYGNGITNEAMILNHQGRLGINNLTPSYLLDVGGDGRVNGTLTCVTLVQTSQRDQKKDIADIDKRKAKAIPFKEYKYKSSIDGSERKRYGVVAEDIENDYPELVHTGADGVKGINYIDLLVKRVAELEKELEDISLTPGPKGDKGDTGAQGPAGANGTNGKNGNSHLSNVSSIALNEKTGQLEVTIGKTTLRFNPAK